MYQLPQAFLSAHMPDTSTVIADLVFTGAAVEVSETSFAVLLPGGLELDSLALTPVAGVDGSRALHWRLVVNIQGVPSTDGVLTVSYTGTGAYPPTTLPADVALAVGAGSPVTLQASSTSGYTIADGRTSRMHSFVYEVQFEEPSTFQASDLAFTIAGSVSIELGAVDVQDTR